jgi:hypothetical protein
MRRIGLVVALVALGACTKKDPLFCDGTHTCPDPTPFCDVNGDYPASDGIKNTCIASPFDAMPACQASTSVCTAGEWKICDASGHVTADETCRLGCDAAGTRCAEVISWSVSRCPATDLLERARTAQAVALDDSTVIDTQTGVVTTGGVKQDLSLTDCDVAKVLTGRSVTLHDVTVTGSAPLLIVSWEPLVVDGHLDARARGTNPGPGDATCPGLLSGSGFANDGESSTAQFPGAGGGGLGGPGAAGGDNNGGSGGVGGSAQTWVPDAYLSGGGCPGGNVTDGSSISFTGGAGGGAIALLSNTSIEINAAAGMGAGVIDVGGGGGERGAGGGSGGFALLEAPVIEILGAGAGIAANGGAGGSWCPNGGTEQGGDGKPSTDPADVSNCNGVAGGAGATSTAAAGIGTLSGGPTVPSYAGGGGGGLGQAVLRTTSADVTLGSGAFISAYVEKDTLGVK